MERQWQTSKTNPKLVVLCYLDRFSVSARQETSDSKGNNSTYLSCSYSPAKENRSWPSNFNYAINSTSVRGALTFSTKVQLPKSKKLYLITTSCCWINLFNLSSDWVTSRSVGWVFLYLEAKTSASLILSEATVWERKKGTPMQNQ